MTPEGLLVGVIVVALIVWLILRRQVRRPGPPAAPSEMPRVRVEVRIERGGPGLKIDAFPDYPLKIVGESYRQAALEDIVEVAPEHGRVRGDDSAECPVTACLVLEDDNPHDDQAVKIMIEGRHVGYLSRADVRRYRRMDRPREEVPALIVGGWDRGDRGTGHYGVRLALELPD